MFTHLIYFRYCTKHYFFRTNDIRKQEINGCILILKTLFTKNMRHKSLNNTFFLNTAPSVSMVAVIKIYITVHLQ